ncbi:ABC transporter permease subunit, partial [Noviherbaspirillum denitrificans]|uniref:ABC transporter permease subunit n=1 Tax=Noviherbaspirillum denitrificans TaxID=1968433 RepID=UPI003B3A358C
PAYVTAVFGLGSALAALAGVVAAPIIQITPLMGGQVIIVLFAIVVIGGMGSILGAAVTGLFLGLVEGIARVVYPEASSTVIFLAMVIVLLIRPAGLFGRE